MLPKCYFNRETALRAAAEAPSQHRHQSKTVLRERNISAVWHVSSRCSVCCSGHEHTFIKKWYLQHARLSLLFNFTNPLVVFWFYLDVLHRCQPLSALPPLVTLSLHPSFCAFFSRLSPSWRSGSRAAKTPVLCDLFLLLLPLFWTYTICNVVHYNELSVCV